MVIVPNFNLLCQQYLRDAGLSGPSVPSVPCTNDNNGNTGGNSAVHGGGGGAILVRRATVSGTSLFNVDGFVRELGSDYLPFPDRVQPIQSIEERTERHIDEQHVDRQDSMQQVDEQAEGQGEGGEGGEGRDAGRQDSMQQVGEQAEGQGESSEGQDVGDVDDQPVEEVEEQAVERWIPGPSQFVDPFRRTSGGFALFGRRRSVCVLTTVPERSEN